MRRLILSALSCLLLAHPADAAPRVDNQVALAVDGVTQTRNLPVLLAERLGYFHDEGLDVRLIDAPAKPTPLDLLGDGRANGAVAYYHHTFMSRTDAKLDTEAVVVLGISPGEKLLLASRLRDKVRTPADLKGLRIFTGGANSGKTTAMNALILHDGLSLADYTALKPTSQTDMAKALVDGAADAVVAHEPDASAYVASGTAFVYADFNSRAGVLASLGALYPSTSLYLPTAWVEAHPDQTQHLVNACLRALAFIRTHSAAEIAAALPIADTGPDPQAYIARLVSDKLMFDGDGLMPSEGARMELDAMAALNPAYRGIDVAATYTDRFVTESPDAPPLKTLHDAANP